MSRRAASSVRREVGTASIELVGAVPFLLLAVLVAAQIGLAGQTLWSAAVAARAGARAALVGGDAGTAARRALPPSLRPDAEIGEGDAISVRVGVPALLPGMPHLTVDARASLEAAGG